MTPCSSIHPCERRTVGGFGVGVCGIKPSLTDFLSVGCPYTAQLGQMKDARAVQWEDEILRVGLQRSFGLRSLGSKYSYIVLVCRWVAVSKQASLHPSTQYWRMRATESLRTLKFELKILRSWRDQGHRSSSIQCSSPVVIVNRDAGGILHGKLGVWQTASYRGSVCILTQRACHQRQGLRPCRWNCHSLKATMLRCRAGSVKLVAQERVPGPLGVSRKRCLRSQGFRNSMYVNSSKDVMLNS